MSFPEDINAHLMSTETIQRLIADALRCASNYSDVPFQGISPSVNHANFCRNCSLSKNVPNKNDRICGLVVSSARSSDTWEGDAAFRRFAKEMLDYYAEVRSKKEESTDEIA